MLALRASVSALRKSKSHPRLYLVRALERRLDATKSIVAMAYRLARYIYAMVTRGEAYLQRSLADLEEKQRERQTSLLHKLAEELKRAIVPQ